jgi:hypothetical protein
LLLGLPQISACDIGEVHRTDGTLSGFAPYVSHPLQPNNCGTPDKFKACTRVTFRRPEEPSSLRQEPLSLPQEPVVGEKPDQRDGSAGVSVTYDPLSQYSRLQSMQEALQRQLEALHQQIATSLDQHLPWQELQQRAQEFEERERALQAEVQAQLATLRQETDSVAQEAGR